MFDILGIVVQIFEGLYHADMRPEARRITIGCAIIVVAAIGCFALWVSWQRGFR